MLWQKLPYESLMPRVVVSGFPKAGLHLAVRMLSPMVQPQPAAGMFADEWVGTFAGHAWTTEWLDSRSVCYRIGRVQPGHYVKGHLGHRDEIEQFMYYLGAAHVFVHRDLRDVAVSQAYHALAQSERQFQHDGKAVFQQMSDSGGFERVLVGVIEGVGPWAGLVERWRLYAPWLESEWTLAVSFREMREEPLATANKMVEYCLRRTTGSFGLECLVDGGAQMAMAERMVEAAEARHLSPTYRRGEVGGWVEHWTPAVAEAFERTGAQGWE